MSSPLSTFVDKRFKDWIKNNPRQVYEDIYGHKYTPKEIEVCKIRTYELCTDPLLKAIYSIKGKRYDQAFHPFVRDKDGGLKLLYGDYSPVLDTITAEEMLKVAEEFDNDELRAIAQA